MLRGSNQAAGMEISMDSKHGKLDLVCQCTSHDYSIQNVESQRVGQ
jgi:hypothetical protein